MRVHSPTSDLGRSYPPPPPIAWECFFTRPEIKRFDWIRAEEGAMVGGDGVKLQVKVNSQQESSIILVTRATTPAQEVWDALNSSYCSI